MKEGDPTGGSITLVDIQRLHEAEARISTLETALREAIEGWAGLLDSDYPRESMPVAWDHVARCRRALDAGTP